MPDLVAPRAELASARKAVRDKRDEIRQQEVAIAEQRAAIDSLLRESSVATAVYWVSGASSGTIVRAKLDGTEASQIVTGSALVALAIDVEGARIYYSSAQSISRASLDGGAAAQIVSGMTGAVNAIAIDRAAGKLYWAQQDGKLLRANLDGSSQQTLRTAQGAVQALALNTASGQLYWINNTSGDLLRGNADGSGAVTTVRNSTINARGLAVDPVAGKIYWTDQRADHIARVNLDGTGFEVLWSELNPMGLTLDLARGTAYWTVESLLLNALRSAPLDRSTAPRTLVNGVSNGRAVALAEAPQDAQALAALNGELATRIAARDALVAQWNTLRQTAHTRLQSFVSSLPTSSIFDTTLEPNRPVALFPVRLETNFQRVGFSVHLLVRVYPDEVHVEQHEPALSADESTAGAEFWSVAEGKNLASPADADEASILRQAWAALVVDVGDVERALYVKQVTDPSFSGPVAARTPEWTSRPVSRVLPDRWVVMGFRNGSDTPDFTRYGAAIPDALALAPAASLETAAANTAAEMFDSETRWLVDFAQAEQVGMGIRIDLFSFAPAPIETLMVLGVKASLQPESVANGDTASRRLSELFAAHRYTAGVGLLRPGTPTNNADKERSTYTDRTLADAAYDIAFRDEPAPNAADPLTFTDADHAQRIFGFAPGPSGPFAHVQDGNARENTWAHQLNFVLWRSTFGYFLDQFMNKEKQAGLWQLLGEGTFVGPLPNFDHNANAYGQRHFARHVRGSGNAPVLRVGNQPYGLQPILAWPEYLANPSDPDAARDTAVVNVLKGLRDTVFLPATGSVLTATNNLGSARDAILQLLSWSHAGRDLYSRTFESIQHVSQYWQFLDGVNIAQDDVDRHRFFSTFILGQLGLATLEPRGRDLFFGNAQSGFLKLDGPVVHDGPLSNTEPLAAGSYLHWLSDYANTSWRNVDLETGSPFPATTSNAVPMLYMMLRHAYLIELAWHMVHYGAYVTDPAMTAQVIGIALGVLQGPQIRRGAGLPPVGEWHIWEPPFVYNASDVRASPRLSFERPVNRNYLTALYFNPGAIELQPNAALGDYMSEVRAFMLSNGASGRAPQTGHSIDATFKEFWQHLDALKQQPSAVLERNTRSVVDLCSHRLDAWFSSYANKRLSDVTAALPAPGVHIGGYGFVQNLEMRTTPRSIGHAFAPSSAQATTAAILRGAQIAHSVDASTRNLLGVNLSSTRVREAQYLLDGVRQGQPLGALLGYRFERALHDRSTATLNLDQFILPFRTLCPLVANQLPEQPDPQLDNAIENIAASNVVDGLAIVRKQREGAIPWGTQGLPAAGGAVSAAIADLERAVDAVADTLLAESVYQAVRGNQPRGAGVFDSLNRGEAPVPELEVLNTPRNGTAFTHRVVAFARSSSTTAGWPQTTRALAEPRLNSWVGALLGSPLDVRARARIRDAQTNHVIRDLYPTLAELGLAPLDVLYGAASQSPAAESPIGLRVLARLHDTNAVLATEVVEVELRNDGTWTPPAPYRADIDAIVSVAEALQKTFALGRSLMPGETALPNQAEPAGSGPNTVELDGRVSVLEAELFAVEAGMSAAIANAAVTVATLRGLLLRAASLGIVTAEPGLVQGAADVVLSRTLDQARAAHKELVRRRASAAALRETRNATSPALEGVDLVTHDFKVLRTVLGEGFQALVSFTPSNPEELQQAAAVSTALQRGNAREATTFVQRMSRVRSAMEAFSDSIALSGALAPSDAMDLTVAQIPFTPADPSVANGSDVWLALPRNGAPVPQGDRLSLVLHSAEPIDVSGEIAGFVVDEWVEVIPSAMAEPALAFHYDTPASRPPQAILFAVPARMGSALNLQALRQAVLDTIDLAKMRMIEPTLIPSVAHYLPATAHTISVGGAQSEEISTDFSRNVRSI